MWKNGRQYRDEGEFRLDFIRRTGADGLAVAQRMTLFSIGVTALSEDEPVREIQFGISPMGRDTECRKTESRRSLAL